MADTNYEDLVKQAERAVAPVKDPELKRIAFEKILDALLETPEADRDIETRLNKGRAKRSGASKSVGTQKTPKKRAGTAAYIEELIDEQFFAKPKTIAAVKAELGNRGHHIPLTSLSGPLQSLCQRKKLRREKNQSTDGGKKAFAYSNW
jgi:seryl-tRNA synthetase